MTNEEIIEEILNESEELKIRRQVLERSVTLHQLFPNMSILDSIEAAFNEIKNELDNNLQ